MTIQDIMTMNPDWCPKQAARIMKETNVGMLPVVKFESGRKVIGVVTDRDLCLAMIAAGKHPGAVQVGEAMTSYVVAYQSDDVRKAADLMQDNQVRRIPVVDGNGLLEGIVSKPMDQVNRPRAKMQRAA